MHSCKIKSGRFESVVRLMSAILFSVVAIQAVPAFAAVPGAPIIGITSAGSNQAAVNFSSPAVDGGSAIIDYTVTSSPGGLTATGGASPITVTGLTNGTVYTFKVTARNSSGSGPSSAASNNTTPRLYAPTTGTINNLVVFIRFSDQPQFSQPFAYYTGLFNTDSKSLKQFYLENSYGALTVNSFFPAPTPSSLSGDGYSYMDIHPTTYYLAYNASTNPGGYHTAGEGTQRETELVTNALNAVKDQIPAGMNLDSDGDGFIDHITFEVYSSVVNPQPGMFFSRATYDTSGSIMMNGKQVGSYTWVAAPQDSPEYYLAATEIHEMGHSFGYPDLRANSGRTPVGDWDVMSMSKPVHSGAYMKNRFTHWIATIPEITTYGTYVLNDITQASNNSFKIKLPNTNNEFLILEYRKAAGPFESNLPGSGLCITRVNEAAGVWGNLGGPPFFLYYFRPGGTLASDGGSSNSFACLNAESGRIQFNDASNPACFLSDGSPCGISIDNIGTTSGSSISFSVVDPATTTVKHLISGYLYNGGNRVVGATVTLSGDASGVVTTDSLGRYLFTVNAGGNYTITPAKANMTFTPASATYTNVISDQNLNFPASKITNTISGTVTSGGSPLSGITVVFNCPAGGNYVGSMPTDAAGMYSFLVDAGSTCSVWPSKINYNFLPNSKNFSAIATNQVQDFSTNSTTITLSGTITLNGSPISGVTVSCPGATTPTPTTTDGSGSYSFSVIIGNGSGYTVTPSSSLYTFSPVNRVYSGLFGSQVQNFPATLKPASATVLGSSLNPGIFGQSVTFSATVSGSAPTGSVTFNDGASVLCSAVPLSNGQAQCSSASLGVGSHSIVASYSGDGNNAGSNSPALIQIVATVPGAPVSVSATGGTAQAIVSFSAPISDGGAAITVYTVTSNPGNITAMAGGSPITITGLTNGTGYTFTVTASNVAGTGVPSGQSNSIIPLLYSNLSVTIAGSGGGSVFSVNTVGIACMSGTCASPFPFNSSIDLSPTADAVSTFANWTGDCTGSGVCSVAMLGDKNVSAVFNLAPVAKDITTNSEYADLPAALAAAPSGAEIWTLDTQLDGDIALNITTTLKGGWNAAYLGKSGQPTTLNGNLTIKNGDSLVETIAVKGKITLLGGSLRANAITVWP